MSNPESVKQAQNMVAAWSEKTGREFKLSPNDAVAFLDCVADIIDEVKRGKSFTENVEDTLETMIDSAVEASTVVLENVESFLKKVSEARSKREK